ncbi:Phenolic glucoside malonyltransferase 2 [Camellia lanceoleosa]|uniref:Phenolic glucoside malonyltransferase 2 n=1 Tax=Camellia lanceoleosa TaxID=1840588 RepID=A0ACC0J6F1_9ERIC|nr:Phenolic glucoside malonyltransferase 2 [Camellia lanceoleosa]
MAPTPNPVKVVEVCRVTPTPPTSTSSCSAAPTSLPLTFFDVFWVKFSPGAILDGKTSALFMHSWASICRGGGGGLSPELTPFYDRTIINDPDEFERKYLTMVLQHSGSKNNNNDRRSLMILNVNASPGTMLVTFQLTRPNIENIKKSVNAQWQAKQSNIFHVSAFTITCAYVWVCLVKARKISRTRKVHIGFIVDCRARLEPHCVSTHLVNADSKDLIAEDGVAVAAKAIGEVIGGLSDRLVKGVDDLSEFALLDMDRVFAIAAFSLSDSTDGNGGLEIGLMLNKQEIEAFPSLFATDSKDLIAEDGVAVAAKAIGEVMGGLSDTLVKGVDD